MDYCYRPLLINNLKKGMGRRHGEDAEGKTSQIRKWSSRLVGSP